MGSVHPNRVDRVIEILGAIDLRGKENQLAIRQNLEVGVDEEIGAGIRRIDLEQLNADFAYTLDGMDVGELTYETFSADKAVITIEELDMTHEVTGEIKGE